ncbi:MAG: ketopantoate reductase C-terminal domain-containing protein [Salipiger thiooxidans]|nr:ketopantoate reductase C-terminal domain-containing protein [Salipiger thiooxidans]
MVRQRRRKRRTELDAQIGTMVELGRVHGLEVPALARMLV